MSDLNRREFALTMAAGLIGSTLPQLAHAELDKIKSGGILKVAVYKDFAPFSYGSANNWQGVDVGLAEALAKEMGLKLSLLPFDAGENMMDDMRNMVWRGHYLGYGPAHVLLHVPVDPMFIRENKQSLIFAPYYRETVVFARDPKKLEDLTKADDLQNVDIAVEKGTAAASALLGVKGGALANRIRITDTPAQAMELLISGKVAVVAATKAQIESALHAAKKPRDDYPLASLMMNGIPNSGWAVGMAVKAEEKDLANALEAALASINTRGELKAIFDRDGVTLGRI